jgi:hypothetical protein
MFKGFAGECPYEARQMEQVLMRIGVEPTGYGVRAKRQHYRADGLIRA